MGQRNGLHSDTEYAHFMRTLFWPDAIPGQRAVTYNEMFFSHKIVLIVFFQNSISRIMFEKLLYFLLYHCVIFSEVRLMHISIMDLFKSNFPNKNRKEGGFLSRSCSITTWLCFMSFEPSSSKTKHSCSAWNYHIAQKLTNSQRPAFCSQGCSMSSQGTDLCSGCQCCEFDDPLAVTDSVSVSGYSNDVVMSK